ATPGDPAPLRSPVTIAVPASSTPVSQRGPARSRTVRAGEAVDTGAAGVRRGLRPLRGGDREVPRPPRRPAPDDRRARREPDRKARTAPAPSVRPRPPSPPTRAA